LSQTILLNRTSQLNRFLALRGARKPQILRITH